MRSFLTRGRSSAAALVAAAVAAVLVVVLIRSLWPAESPVPSDFGDRPGAGQSAAVPSAGPDSGGTAEAGEGADLAGPTALRVPRVSLAARVRGVGVLDDGTVEIPGNVGQVGWYRHGPAPGAAAGSAVLVGHVDDRTGDLGAFAKLYRVAAGDEVTVTRDGAPPVRYEVTAREVVAKDRLPDEVFRRDGPPVLTLITCAPPYDRENGEYRQNLLVYAVPVPGRG